MSKRAALSQKRYGGSRRGWQDAYTVSVEHEMDRWRVRVSALCKAILLSPFRDGESQLSV